MPVDNGTITAVEIVRLQERSDKNADDIENVRSWVGEIQSDVRDVKHTQNQSLLVLQKMETSLEHLNNRLEHHDKADEKLVDSVDKLQLAHSEVSAKFKIVLGILGVIGTTMIGVAVKIMFFSPVLNGGG